MVLSSIDERSSVPPLIRHGMPLPTVPKFSAILLTVPYRVLHYLISHTIIPRGGNHAIVLNTDLFVMWAILNRERIFWPDTFCRIMLVSKRSKTSKLPFPMLIQRIMELKGVPMANEVKTDLKENHKFNSTGLKKEGLHLVGGEWTWDEAAAAADIVPMDEDDHPQADAATAAPPPPPPVQSGPDTSLMDTLLAAITRM